MKSDFYNRLTTIVHAGEILRGESLKKHTTFKVGGPCDYFINLSDCSKLPEIIRLCKEEGMKFFVLGNGSNLIAKDKGYQGVIIHLDSKTDAFVVKEENDSAVVTVEAGVSLSGFAMKIARLSYTGFEFAAGIPGTIGGAVYMNAGAYGGEIKDCIKSAAVVDGDGNMIVLSKEELSLSYRHSVLQEKEYYLISAEFIFKKGDSVKILETIADFNGRRKEKQPLEYPSAGSTFKRPEGYYAGKLIMDSGLRGYRVGGAQVSEKHCGFVINTGDATSDDIEKLIADVIRIVKEKQGVTLEQEVKYIE